MDDSHKMSDEGMRMQLCKMSQPWPIVKLMTKRRGKGISNGRSNIIRHSESEIMLTECSYSLEVQDETDGEQSAQHGVPKVSWCQKEIKWRNIKKNTNVHKDLIVDSVR